MDQVTPRQLDPARSKLLQVFRYLEALNQLRNPILRQIEAQPWALWLSSLPDHPAIEPGDEYILKVRRPALSRAPEPPAALAAWLEAGWQTPDGTVALKPGFEGDHEAVAEWSARREAWADAERPARRTLQIFEQLFALQARIEREAERVELVLGDGLLLWQRPGEDAIRHPVLLQRLTLEFDPEEPAFTLVETDHPPELYTALFRAMTDINAAAVGRSREELDQGGFYPLGGAETDAFLKRLVAQLHPHGELITGDGSGPVIHDDVPRIRRAPVIFLRGRTLGFATALEGILEDLPEREDLPGSLTSIVGIDPVQAPETPFTFDPAEAPNGEDETVLLSKPANAEQLEIARRLDRHGAVLVQGPPGTGKTHTIANVIGHLLAQGKSILVTSHTAKALKVVKEKVEEPLRPLCVSVLDDSSAQLEATVDAITERLASSNADLLERQAAELTQSRREILNQLRESREELRQALMDEYLPLGGMTPAEAARLVADPTHNWVPAPVAAGAELPLTIAELVDLYRSNAAVPASDEAELNAHLPEPESLLSPADLEAMLAERAAITSDALCYRKDLWTQGGPHLPEIAQLQELQARVLDGVEPLRTVEDWRLAALAAGREGGPRRAGWEDLIREIEATSDLAAQAEPLMLKFGPVVPEMTGALKVLDEIIAHLQGGGKLGGLKLMFNGDWKSLIAQSRVKGQPPEELEHFTALRTVLLLQAARRDLADRWQRQMTPLGALGAAELGPEPERVCRQYLDHLRACLDWFTATWAPLERDLTALGFRWSALLAEVPVDPSQHGDLMRLRSAAVERLPVALAAEIARRTWSRNEARRLELLSQLELAETPVMARLRDAVERLNVPDYREAYQRLVELRSRDEQLLRRKELLERLELAAPAWAAAIRDRVGAHGERELPGDPEKAWQWRQLMDELERRADTSAEALQARILQLSADLQRVTAQVVEKKAWAAQVRLTTTVQRQALQGWKQLIRRVGKGTGKRVPQLLAEARKLMPVCQTAVPVWIMPLSRVVENFDPRRNRFDVIIIDEASQADVLALSALYLGSQVMVVGDHEQVSPVAVGLKVDEIQQLIEEHLTGIPNAVLYDGQFSIYDLAQTTFEPVVLREHFRCVAPIIQFSNHLSYNGKIKPLRDASEVTTRPHTLAYRVEGASSTGKVNEAEARAVASLLIAAAEQPEYKEASFGVISMLGDEQAARVDALLQRRMSTAEYARRRVQVGNPAEFQGDERDVVFLSLVDTAGGGEAPLNLRAEGAGNMFKKRYNVAASRARDQLWVVYSLDPERDLKPGDIRLRLIRHAQDPASLLKLMEGEGQGTGGAAEEESNLTRLVGRHLTDLGYQVTAGYPVGAFRIDLVVSGGGKRLAVACDGDRFETADKVSEELARQAILERLGWRFVRVRGSLFYRDPVAALAPVLTRLQELGIPGEGQPVPTDVGGAELHARIIARAAELRQAWAQG